MSYKIKKSRWKQTVNQKGNLWWQVGTNKENSLWLPKKWIAVQEETPYGKKEFGVNWEVRADKKINPETVYGHSKFYKRKSDALKFAKKYRENN